MCRDIVTFCKKEGKGKSDNFKLTKESYDVLHRQVSRIKKLNENERQSITITTHTTGATRT